MFRKLNQAYVAFNEVPSRGLQTGDNTGPMGGSAPTETTGPSGMAGPTASGDPQGVVTPSGLDSIQVVQRRTAGALRCRLPIFYECALAFPTKARTQFGSVPDASHSRC
eukprot:jgi/Botrbrau1/10465/Bobra.0133s0071.1